MIGYITTKEQADFINSAIAKAQTDRGFPVFWLAGSPPINSGEYVGNYFIPADDHIFDTPLCGNPIQTPRDFPEFLMLIELLGGLDARIDLDPEAIKPLQEVSN